MTEKGIKVHGIVYRKNVDPFCRALLEDLCKVEGVEFSDPGLEHLWVVPLQNESSLAHHYSIQCSKELQVRLENVSFWPYTDTIFIDHGHKWLP